MSQKRDAVYLIWSNDSNTYDKTSKLPKVVFLLVLKSNKILEEFGYLFRLIFFIKS